MIFEIFIEITESKTSLFPKDRKPYNVYGIVRSDTLTKFGWSNSRESYSLSNEIDDFTFSPLKQDFIPDWYSFDDCSKRAVSAVKEWAKDHIHIGINNLSIKSGSRHIIINCTNVVIDGGSVDYIGGYSHVLGITDSNVTKIADDVVVKIISGSSIICRISDFAKVECVVGNALIVDLEDEAIIIDCSDNVKVFGASNSSMIGTIRDNASVAELKDKSFVGRKLN